MNVSIIIPAFNEEFRLRAMLEDYSRFFEPRYGDRVELIVVVNGSRDRTEEVARECAAAFSRIKVLVEPRAVGKGGAIMIGFREASGDIVGFVDADNSTPPEAFNDLIEHIGEAGVMIASRWIEGARVSPRQPLKRRVASRIFNALVRSLFKLRIHDTQCGAKVMTRDAVQAVLPKLGLTRWAFDVDLLFQARRSGYRIVERPTVWHDAPGSQLRVGKASAEMFVAICRLRLVYSPFRWVVSIYDRTLGRIIHLRA